MSMQQVNLYLPEFKPKKEPLMAVQMLMGLVVLVLIMTLISVYGSWRNGSLQEKLAVNKKKMEQTQLQVDQLKASQPKSRGAQLDREIQRLENEIVRRQQIRELVADQNLGNSSGFSEHMLGMSRQYLSNVAIERFTFTKGGGYAELFGWTRSADQVPLYLQKLRTEDSFQDVSFGVLDIERSDERQDAMKFSVADPEGKANG